MRPVTVSVTGVNTSTVIPMDTLQNPFNAGFGVKAPGTLTYTVEHSFDNIFDPTVTPTWYPNLTVVNITTGNKDGNYAFAVRALRLNVTAGSGTAVLTVIQST